MSFLSTLSYREKSLYASFIIELSVYGLYVFLHQQNSVNNVTGMIIAIIVLQIILQAGIAIFSRNRLTDERDRLIELRGYRVGYFTLASLMVFGLGMLWLHATAHELPVNKMGLHFLSVFFSMLVISDIAKTATQLVAYRRAV